MLLLLLMNAMIPVTSMAQSNMSSNIQPDAQSNQNPKIQLNSPSSPSFDHDAWSELLQKHVHWTVDGHASTVNYASLSKEKPKLQAYLDALSSIPLKTFEEWSRPTQLAFLINAYNAFTVQLVLSRYPKLKSIKDLGSLIESPWKKSFAPLLGQMRTLDDIEHGLIRGSGRYPDPRIHFAVNCASIGCPALRPEAYVPEKLDAQLEDQTQRFFGDSTRNRIKGNKLEISPILKWYRGDFEKGFRGDTTLQAFLYRYANHLQLSSAQAQALRAAKLAIVFGDYDWLLNDGRQSP